MDEKIKKDKRGLNPNSRKNLELGRKPNIRTSKLVSITRNIRKILEQPCDVTIPNAKGKTWVEVIAWRICYEAAKGNSAIIKELLDRTDGKVAQTITGEDGGPMTFSIQVASAEAKRLTEDALRGK